MCSINKKHYQVSFKEANQRRNEDESSYLMSQVTQKTKYIEFPITSI
jgi:hypothetical protein